MLFSHNILFSITQRKIILFLSPGPTITLVESLSLGVVAVDTNLVLASELRFRWLGSLSHRI